jgi:uncharacterized protein YggE
LRQYKDQARDMALKAAKEKATAMAGSIGQTIGKAIRITEGTVSNTNLNYSNISANGQMVANARSIPAVETTSTSIGSFSPGTITVSATATVIFILN